MVSGFFRKYVYNPAEHEYTGLKSILQRIMDAHWLSGRDAHTFVVIKEDSKDIIELIKSCQPKGGLLKEQENLKKQLPKFLAIVMKNLRLNFIIVNYGAKLFYHVYEEEEKKQRETKRLALDTQIPSADAEKIVEKFVKGEGLLKKDIAEVQKRFLNVKRLAKSPAFLFLYRALPRAHKKWHELGTIEKRVEDFEKKLKEDESAHAIGLIHKDFDKIADWLVHESNILKFVLICVAKEMKQVYEILENIIKEAGKIADEELKNFVTHNVNVVVDTWKEYIGIDAVTFARLRFGGSIDVSYQKAA